MFIFILPDRVPSSNDCIQKTIAIIDFPNGSECRLENLSMIKQPYHETITLKCILKIGACFSLYYKYHNCAALLATATTTFRPRYPATLMRTHPITSAWRFRRSIPRALMPVLGASSISVLFERSGMYLKSNVVSCPSPLSFSTITFQKILRNA